MKLDASPFVAAAPGQNQDASPDLTPRGLDLGELDWAPIASRCAFVRMAGSADSNQQAIPEPGQSSSKANGYGRFVFVTMLADASGGAPPLERGYVMANGLVRELEKGKTAAGKTGTVMTVWRSAGEPRISVNLDLSGVEQVSGHAEYEGEMTVFWGDKKEAVPVRGRCN
ncbi:hypothetical protein LQ948_03005 [Jiella sp. MQZ9-1]|nr:hypothetical protein [Jiella flava]